MRRMSGFTSAAVGILALLAPSVAAKVFFVSQQGNDAWSGAVELPRADGADGPLATLGGARDAIRRFKAGRDLAEAVEVVILPGRYVLPEPFVLAPEDSGTEACPITYRGRPGAEPIISGGRRIAGLRREGELWVADLPEVAAGAWSFSTLWFNGERRARARLPATGYSFTAGVAPPLKDPATGKETDRANRAFRFSPGDIKPWPNLDDVFVVVYHSWETSIHRIAAVDTAESVVTFTGGAPWAFQYWGPRQRFHIENAPEPLAEAGTWRLERAAGRLLYRPMPGEALETAEVIAPVLRHLVLLNGAPEASAWVKHVRFESLRFHHAAWPIGPGGHGDSQAAFSVEAAVQARGGRSCSFVACEIAHIENYGVWLRTGCRDATIERCHVHDLGAGGVRIGEGSLPENVELAASHCVVDNCFIHDGGKIFHGAVGAWIGKSSHNALTHNEICDFDYTGVSVGWSWGYAKSSAHHNRIEHNHIHHLGRGVLNDMGSIYTLGISPGTVERGNLMHDIYCYVFGGWGVYTDEGSSEILIENNLVYNTSSGCFHQHYGRENVLRNNIFAFGQEGVLRRSREEEHTSFIFERNLVLAAGTPLHIVGWTNGMYRIDRNLYWDLEDPAPEFFGMEFAQWQALGRDQGSIVADPLFADPRAYDFTLKAGSPAARIDFKPLALAAGLYGDPAWVALPTTVRRTPYTPPRLPSPRDPIAEDFEAVAPGEPAPRATTQEEGAGTIRVSEEAAAAGARSLKFVDAPGLRYRFNPHLFYTVDFKRARVRASFALRREAGAVMYHEWRDAASPYHAGPTLRIEADGKLHVRGRELMTVPAGAWARFTITCDVGLGDAAAFDLTVQLPGETASRTFAGLPSDPAFRRCQWVGFVADGDADAALYLDTLEIQTIAR